ncbi:MAG: S-methyl-5-thioadenosine phosphorylase [Icmadophila ericetorum]|nr:S-methyl-5-thioadenosine phosphorylase [Icmadophila ericetorum]
MIAFLARHGLHHELAPHEVPSRANIAALRKLGARCVVAFSAVGSLREEVKPRDFLVPDQVIDRTKGIRPFTYFEGGVVSHVPFADPFDDKLRDVVIKAVHGKGVLEGEDCKIHDKGILVCMGTRTSPSITPSSTCSSTYYSHSILTLGGSTVEGPQFSTRAESHLYRSWSASVINMSCLPEAKLAREAELSYAMICMSTDYDSWHSTHEDVTVEMVMGHMRANAENAGRVVLAVIDEVGKEVESGEEAGILSGQKWKGLAVGGLSTGHAGRGKEAVERLKWLFPENF